ncbi:hypothetical protein BR1R3_07620 [Pseudomonas atacamensis]|uniref:Uncharacterized protein n=1 Tax=Pseudomonas moraviensis R28-S TaxID=1395516 RepID=V8R3M1_9PSED|nr:hypothetical protein PMO01_21765 [Pseudomonas moraviensis R28-S]GLH18021.1 hypothetical protein BR1R3_07620 [Pseudomonas atacamensis]
MGDLLRMLLDLWQSRVRRKFRVWLIIFVRLKIVTPLTPALSPKGGEGEREPIYVDFNI